MKFLLMLTDIAGEWDRVPPAEQARVMDAHAAINGELTAQGRLVGSHRLRPPTEARTVRLERGGDRVVHDGPFAERFKAGKRLLRQKAGRAAACPG